MAGDGTGGMVSNEDATGGAVGDGDSTGGLAGDGDGTGGTPLAEAAHCSPGKTIDGPLAYFAFISNCPEHRSIELEQPLLPGESYAFSAHMGSGIDAEMEIWGTTEECGEPVELLATAPMGPDVVCMELNAQEGTYSHLLWVWNSRTAAHDDVTLCPAGRCGP